MSRLRDNEADFEGAVVGAAELLGVVPRETLKIAPHLDRAPRTSNAGKARRPSVVS